MVFGKAHTLVFFVLPSAAAISATVVLLINEFFHLVNIVAGLHCWLVSTVLHCYSPRVMLTFSTGTVAGAMTTTAATGGSSTVICELSLARITRAR